MSSPIDQRVTVDTPGLGGARPAEWQLVIRRDPQSGLPTEGFLRWGLIPHTMKARPEIAPIHARAEGIAEKPMFSGAYRSRRCLVPMNEFFQRDKQGKRYAIAMTDGSLFSGAGIWENWRNPVSGEWERTFAIVTVPANSLIEPINDRMLAILRRGDYARWLGTEPDPRELLKPYPSELMAIRPMGPRRRS